ncbi:hypothetical protein ABPG75_000820 [Micractinium tetrahymenae]
MRAKCTACRAVADVLIERLENEVPRNHLDLRHRLDKDGKRYGKMIEYRMSELRVIHLLEDLCDGMSKYELVEGKNESEPRWARSDSLGANRNLNVHLVKEQRKELQNFCHDLLERQVGHEDSISHALRNGEVDTESASDFLCFTTAKHCDQPLDAEEEHAAADGTAAAADDGEQQPETGTAATDSAGSVKQEL